MSNKVIRLHQPCPSCNSSDAYCEYEDGHGYCFSCTKYFPPTKGYTNVLNDETFTYEIIPHRGIVRESFAFYDVKTKINSEGKPVEIGFRYPNDSYKIRNFDKKTFHTKGEINKAGLFGRDKFSAGSHKYVTITEGEYDAISLYQVLRSPVVSVQSSSTAERDCILDFDFLSSFERVYLAFDNDEAGRKAVSSVSKLFDYNKVYLVKFTKRKDANEYLQNGEEDELRNIWWNSKRYMPDNIISSFNDFAEALQEDTKWGVPYPFPTLNSLTYGIRPGESVLITALEGVGKTELMHAIEYQLLKETDENVGAIFLEEPKRRHLQALAGIHLKQPVHLPDCGIGQDQVIRAVQEVIRKSDRLYVYSHFGSDDPEILCDTIRFLVSACSCRYVLLDHITMAVSGLSGEDERLSLDRLSTKLEMMVKELNFSLILVSHVNDEGLTRGSRYISKVADIRIDATRDITSANPVVRNTTNLVVSKNRYAGRTGPAGQLYFDENTYTLHELGGSNDDVLDTQRL